MLFRKWLMSTIVTKGNSRGLRIFFAEVTMRLSHVVKLGLLGLLIFGARCGQGVAVLVDDPVAVLVNPLLEQATLTDIDTEQPIPFPEQRAGPADRGGLG